MASPPEKEVKDLTFKEVIRLKIGDVGYFAPRAPSLITVCNKYDLIFVGFEKGFRVLRASDIDKNRVSMKKPLEKIIDDFSFLFTVMLESSPLHLAVSCDGLTLSVCIQKTGFIFAQLYDMRAFLHPDKVPQPFLDVKLSSGKDDYLMDLAWNPGLEFASVFAFCISDGSVCLYEVKNTNLNIMASLKQTAQGTCLCWSPKGKQLIVGKSSGELVQYDQRLAEKKVITFPPGVYGGGIPCSVMDVFWESTQVFFVAYQQKENGSDEQPWIVTITASKEGTSYKHQEAVCYGSEKIRNTIQKYYFQPILEWGIIICSYSNSLETAVLDHKLENKNLWEIYDIPGACRPDIPIGNDDKEYFSRGLGVSLNSSREIEISDSLKLPPCPYILILSTDGCLLCFNIMYNGPGAVALTRAPDVLSADLERKSFAGASKPGEPATQNAHPGYQPIFGGQAVVDGRPSTTLTSIPFKGQPTFGSQVLLGTLPGSGQLFGSTAQPATQAKPQLLATAVTPQTALPDEGGNLLTASGQSNLALRTPFLGLSSVASEQGLAPSKVLPTYSQSGAQKPPNSSTGAVASKLSTTGQQDVARGQLTHSSILSSPGNSTIFGTSLNLGKPLAQSTPAIPVQAVTAKPQTSVTTNQPASVSFPVPQSFARLTTAKGGLGLAPASKPPFPSGTGSGFTFDVNKPAAAAAVTAASVTASSVVSKLPTAISGQETTASVTSGKTVNRKQPAEQTESPFWRYIIDEMNQFSREVHDLRSRASSVSIDIGTASDKETLRKGTSQEAKLCKAIMQTTRERNEAVSEVKTEVIESWALFEQCCQVKERNCDPNYEKLLQERPLNPDCERKLKTILSTFHYVNSEAEKIDAKLDDEWDAYEKKRKNKRLLETPPMHAVYEALKNNNQTIRKHEMQLESLCARLQELNICRSSIYKMAAAQPAFMDNMTNGEKLKDERANETKRRNSAVARMKEARLRGMLGCRRAAPVVSSAPNNLSYSKIVSAKDLKEMLQSGSSAPNVSPQASSSTLEAKAEKAMRGNAEASAAAVSLAGKTPSSGRIVKAAFRSAPGQKEVKAPVISRQLPAASSSASTQQLTYVTRNQGDPPPFGATTSAAFGNLRNVKNQETLAKHFAQSHQPTGDKKATEGLSFTQKGFNFGASGLKGFPAAASSSFGLGLGATVQNKTSHESFTAADVGQNQTLAHAGQLPNVTSLSALRLPGQLEEGAPPVQLKNSTTSSSTTSFSGFSFMPATSSQVPTRQLLTPIGSKYDDEEEEEEEEDENEDEEYGDGYNTDVSQELTENEYDQRPPKATSVANANVSRVTPVQKPTDSVAQVPVLDGLKANTKGLTFGMKTDTESTRSGMQSLGVAGSSVGEKAVTSAGGGDGGSGASFASAGGVTSVFGQAISSLKGSTLMGSLLFGQQQAKAGGNAADSGTDLFKKQPLSGIVTATEQKEANIAVGDEQREASGSEVIKSDTPISVSSHERNNDDSKDKMTGSKTVAEDSLQDQPSKVSSFVQPSESHLIGHASTVSSSSSAAAAGSNSLFIPAPIASSSNGSSLFGQAASTASGDGSNDKERNASVSSQAIPSSTTSTSLTATASTSGTTSDQKLATTISEGGTGLVGQAVTATNTSTSGSLSFGQAVATTSAGGTSSFGQTTTTTSAVGTSLFGQTVTTTSTSGTGLSGLFGQSLTTNTTSNSGTGLFGQSLTTNTTSNSGTGLFGQSLTTNTASTSGTGLFGQLLTTSTTSNSGTGLFGQSLTTSTTSNSGTGLFGQSLTASTTSNSGTGLFGQQLTTNTASTSGTGLFGQSLTTSTTSNSSTGLFGQPLTTNTASTSGTGLFGQPLATNTTQTTSVVSGFGLFSQPQNSFGSSGIFGQTQTSSAFGQSSFGSGGLFGQPFGQQSQSVSSASVTVFGQTTSASPFGQPQSTQSSAPGFGSSSSLSQQGFGSATSVFGTQSPSRSSLFGQTATSSSGSGGGLFGFAGLGGKPDSQKANTNVFGSPTFGSSQQNTGIFAQTSTSSFGSVKTEASITGAFSGGGSSIQSAGFGGFAKSPQTGAFGSGASFGSPAPGFGGAAAAFGSPAAFGGSAAFGGAPAFSSPPSFGSPAAFGGGGGNALSSAFGTGGTGQMFGSGDTNSGAFASFASSNAPSFGSLAMQSDQPTFGSPAPQQQPSTGFGGFGVGSGGGTFGSGFGGAGQNLPSTFTSYRK